MDTLAIGLVPLVALGVPVVLALAGLAATRHVALASATSVLLAVLFAIGASLAEVPSGFGARADVPTRVMLVLVATLGAVVVRFSQTYLTGERGLDRYFRWLMLTLSAVTVLVISDNLLVIAAAWTATSLALHQLLTFYAERPAALVAAHKKFLVSRLADGALALTLWLLYTNVQSFDLERIAAWVAEQPRLPLSMHVGACLLVVTVALRSAQLPFHGWITQVMEAPTPVSALLHAGVVNIGGFVLIRMSPWMTRSEPAQALLVGIGLVTAIVASLVMTTRVSVKVALAWSTAAQMGFMLVQCGLGLWPLALLHIVAHSLYKAYAFLSAGSAVEDWRSAALAAPPAAPSLPRLGLATVGALVVAHVGIVVVRASLGLPPLHGVTGQVLTVLLGLSLVPLAQGAPSSARAIAMAALRVSAVTLLYVGWHGLAEHVLPAKQAGTSLVLWWTTAASFLGLFALKSALQRRPEGALAQRLHPWLFSGLYLDELFTRLTFRVWPPRLAPRRVPEALRSPAPAEARS